MVGRNPAAAAPKSSVAQDPSGGCARVGPAPLGAAAELLGASSSAEARCPIDEIWRRFEKNSSGWQKSSGPQRRNPVLLRIQAAGAREWARPPGEPRLSFSTPRVPRKRDTRATKSSGTSRKSSGWQKSSGRQWRNAASLRIHAAGAREWARPSGEQRISYSTPQVRRMRDI